MIRPLLLIPALAGLLPLLLLLLTGCGRAKSQGELRKLDAYALTVETPEGWTGGGASGTYEFRSPDGAGRLRVAPLEGATAIGGLKDAQMLAGTGAVATSRVLPSSPTKVGPLSAERARFSTGDGRIYEVVAVQTQKGVVLFQASVAAARLADDPSGVEALFTALRQSIQSTK